MADEDYVTAQREALKSTPVQSWQGRLMSPEIMENLLLEVEELRDLEVISKMHRDILNFVLFGTIPTSHKD